MTDTWNGYIGQQKVKERLAPYIAQAKATGKPLPHIFIESEPGNGKTHLAQAIAAQVGDPFEVVDFSKMTEKQMQSYFRRYEGGIVFWDECHLAAPAQQGRLLQVMWEGVLTTPFGGVIEVPFFTMIGVTTDAHKMLPAVISRFALQLALDPYSDEEMALIVAEMGKSRVEMDDDTCLQLGQAAAGNPRKASDLVKAYEALTYTGEATVEKTLMVTDTAFDGLASRHLNYLRVLHQLEGQAGERPLCNVLRVHPSALRVTERVLVDRGYITMGPQGRMLLAAGDRRLNGGREQQHRRAS